MSRSHSRDALWSALGSIAISFCMVCAFAALTGFFAYAFHLSEWLPGEIVGAGVVFTAILAVLVLAELKGSVALADADDPAERARRSAEKDVGIVDKLSEFLECERPVVVARVRQLAKTAEDKKSEKASQPPPVPKSVPEPVPKARQQEDQRELKRLRQELRESEDRNRALREENLRICSELTAATSEARILGGFRDMCTRLTEEKELWTTERGELLSRIDRLTVAESALRGERDTARVETERVRQQSAEEVEAVRVRFESALQSWKAERTALEGRISFAETALNARTADFESARVTIELKSGELSAKADELAAVNEVLETTSALLTEREADLECERAARIHAEAQAAEALNVISHFSEHYPEEMEASLAIVVDGEQPDDESEEVELPEDEAVVAN